MSVITVQTATDFGLAVGLVGKGKKPHALASWDATFTGRTLCDKDAAVNTDQAADTDLCATCARELDALITAKVAGATGDAADVNADVDAADDAAPVTAAALRTVWYDGKSLGEITRERLAELLPDTTTPELDEEGNPGEDAWDNLADLINTADEESDTLTPGLDDIETTQDREQQARQEAEEAAKPSTVVAVTHTNHRVVEGLDDILNAGSANIAKGFKAALNLGLTTATTMLQLRRFILRDGLPVLDGKGAAYTNAVKDLFDMAAERVTGIGAEDKAEIRKMIKRAAQNQASAVMVPYVNSLDTDPEEAARYAALMTEADAARLVAVEAAQAAVHAADAANDQDALTVAHDALEAAQQPLKLSDLVFTHYGIPRQTRQEIARADAARKRELANSSKAGNTPSADDADGTDETAETTGKPVETLRLDTPRAILGNVEKVLSAVPLAPLTTLEGEDRDAVLKHLEAVEKLIADMRDAIDL